MRPLAIDVDLSPPQAVQAVEPRRPSMLARLHWPRIIGLAIAAGLWPLIIFAVSRFF